MSAVLVKLRVTSSYECDVSPCPGSRHGIVQSRDIRLCTCGVTECVQSYAVNLICSVLEKVCASDTF